MWVPGRIGVLLLAALAAPPAAAINRCVTPAGRVVYTSDPCESVGGRLERQVSREVSVVPAQNAPKGPAARPAAPGEPPRTGLPFRKSPDAPVLTVCYEHQDARKEVTREQVEAAIRGAVALWNAGCNVTFEFLGSCAADPGRGDRPIDYRVWWASWDDTMRAEGRTFRDHAIAAASPRIGVALNRDVDAAGFQRQWRRSIVHEFGHVVGIGHSANRDDVMFSGGRQETPTASDLAACNQAIERRYGVRSAAR
jgi:hypothetical protein